MHAVHALRHSIPGRTASASAAALGRGAVPTRGQPSQPALAPSRSYISREALRALDASPAGRAGRAAFRFQDSQDSISAAFDMTRRALDAAAGEGIVQQPARKTGLLSRLATALGGSGLSTSKATVSAEAIMALNERHGPVQVILHDMLQPGQGAQSHPRMHSAVVLASYMDNGKRIGVLVDSNHDQANAVMKELRGWMKDAGDTRRLGELGPDDFAAFDKARGAATGLALHQAAFRLVDLDQMVDAAKAALERTAIRTPLGGEGGSFVPYLPNMIDYDRSARATAPMLPEPARSDLVQATRHDPSLVEQFPAKT